LGHLNSTRFSGDRSLYRLVYHFIGALIHAGNNNLISKVSNMIVLWWNHELALSIANTSPSVKDLNR